MLQSSDKILNVLITTAVITMFAVPFEIIQTGHVYLSLFLIPVELVVLYLLFGLKRLPNDPE